MLKNPFPSWAGWAIVAFLAWGGTQRANAQADAQLAAAYQRGLANYQAERYVAATPEFELTVRLAPEVYGADDINTAKLTEFLANCYSEAFRLNEADELYCKCAGIALRAEGAGSPLVVRCQGSRALICFRLNQWDESRELFLASLENKQNLEDWGVRANNLAYLLMTMGRHTEAAAWFGKSLAIWEGKGDDRSRLMAAQIRHGLGMTAYQQNRFAEAERLFEEALEERERLLPADSRWVAQSQGMLGSVYSSLGRDAEALRMSERAEQAYRARWGGDHIDVGLELHEMGLLLARQNELAGAVQKLGESRRIYRKYIGGTLTGLSQPEQLRFLNEERGRFMDVVALTRTHSDNEPLARASLEWVLNEKGMMQQTLAERLLQARDAVYHPELATPLKELNEVRQRLAAVAVAGDEQQTLRNQLTARESDLERQLGRANRQRAFTESWIELSQVANALPENGVLVHLVRVDRSRPAASAFGAKPAYEPKYVAWTLRRSDGRVRVFDLGPAEEIESQVLAVRQTLAQETRPIRQMGEQAAEQQIREQLKLLSERILRPLEGEIGEGRRLVLSPDGALWLVPWAALVTADGQYAVEKYALSYAIRGFDATTGDSRPTSAPVIMADPDFDLSAGGVQEALNAIYRDRAAPRIPTAPGGGIRARFGRFRRLPGTAKEAAAIAPSLELYANGKPNLYMGKFALESVFRRLRKPSAIVLSTHGFFLEEVGRDGDTDPASVGDNPLLRCGVLLAGSNASAETSPAANEDGFLTGLEIVGTDLQGTELVVLSACETGLGQVQSGEGVAGLRQAFHLAGARTVVATLWRIPDQESAGLMKTCFDNLANRQPPAEALSQAQAAAIRDRRRNSGAAHPYYWAAYTVTER